MQINKTILVAPLNWGLGHATRCIPIINTLQENGYTPLLASDGAAIELLKKEFPHLEHINLPSYHITYAKKAWYFKWKLLFESPKMLRAIIEEKKLVNSLVSSGKIHAIISDNRLGVRSSKVPSVFITHQLQVLTGKTTWLSTQIHRRIINKFNECWVPDVEGTENLSGILGHPKKLPAHVKYIGPLSRMENISSEKKYDILVLLSGPEPQRTFLEEKLMRELQHVNQKIVFVLGKVEPKQTSYNDGNFLVYNFMNTPLLERTINESEIVISRSGYTTIMDLAVIGKKAFFIPTPGQFEQEYLARKLEEKGIVPFCKQEEFTSEKLESIKLYNGLRLNPSVKNLGLVFELFQGE